MSDLRTTVSALALLALTFGGNAQNSACDGSRYKVPLFAGTTKKTAPYATAISHLGQTITLSVDIYEPQGDTAGQRPVVVLAHGGSFVFGNKADMRRWCELLAQYGYVAASIQYRLFPVFPLGFPDSTDIMDAAMKAVGDMKAAVRFFREDAATSNVYRIDPEHIYIGGYSAGAVTALHAGYLDASDALPAFLQDILEDNGGFEGNSGSASNQTYSSAAGAVINMSGGLYRRAWIGPDEIPLSSIHGTADETVPFESGLAANLAYLEGSSLLHAQALTAGTWSYLKKVPGAGHTNLYDQAQYAPAVENYWMRTTALLEFLTCYPDSLPQIVKAPAEPGAPKGIDWQAYPNPVQQAGVLSIQTAGPAQAILTDVQGREVQRLGPVSPGITNYTVSGLSPGFYVLRLFSDDAHARSLGARPLIVLR